MDRDCREKCLLRNVPAGVIIFTVFAFGGGVDAEEIARPNRGSDLDSKLGAWVYNEFDAAASDAEAIENPENLNEVLGRAIKSGSWKEFKSLEFSEAFSLLGDGSGMTVTSWNSAEKKCELLPAMGIQEPFDTSDWDIIRSFELEECVAVKDKAGELFIKFSNQSIATPTNQADAPE